MNGPPIPISYIKIIQAPPIRIARPMIELIGAHLNVRAGNMIMKIPNKTPIIAPRDKTK
jgi:hypothetical protein